MTELPLTTLRADKELDGGEREIPDIRPSILGSYKVIRIPGKTQKLANGPVDRRVLKLPQHGQSLNLLEGYIDVGLQRRKTFADGFHVMLQYISHNKGLFHSDNPDWPLGVDFISGRRPLINALSTHFSDRHMGGWKILASKFKGTIYLCRGDEELRGSTAHEQKCSYGGYKFEDLISQPDGGQEQEDRDARIRHEYNCLLKATFAGHSLVFAAEMDCLSNKPSGGREPLPEDFVEVKTIGVKANKNKKMLDWWSMCYLSGIPTVISGCRRSDFIITRDDITIFEVKDMPSQCWKQWRAETCVTFFERFLQFVKDIVTEDDPNVVYTFQFDRPRGKWQTADIRVFKKRSRIIPLEYVQAFH